MNSLLRSALLLLSLLSNSLVAAADQPQVRGPGYGPLQFDPPPAGSYELPSLGVAVDGQVINTAGKALALHDLIGDKLVLMGFIYTRCSDVNGCPLASYVMGKVQDRVMQDEQLKSRVRLISLSFDPEMDTPQALTDYSHHFRRPGGDWRFLTTTSEAALQPILEGYGQWRQKNYDEDGEYSGSMSHILRVFLIDRQGRIRNIYSTGFLHPDTVINDLKTLELEPTRLPTGS